MDDRRKTMVMYLALLIAVGFAVWAITVTIQKRAVPTVTQVTPAGAPVSNLEIKPLTPEGALAADSLRTHINEINSGYLTLQDKQRKDLDLNSEWVLDLPGNRMLHNSPQPAAPAAGKK